MCGSRTGPVPFTLVLLLGMAMGALYAPSLRAQGIAAGIKLGANRADLSSAQFEFGSARPRTRFVAGAFVSIAGRRLAIQPEFLYAQRGFSVLGAGGSAITDVAYLDVPLLIKIRLRPGRRVRPALITGGFVALETSCKVSGDAAGLPEDGDCDAFFPARGKADAGLVFGGAVDLGITGRSFLVLDARYLLGLSNLNWDENTDNVTSRTFAVMAGVGILLGS